MHLIVSRILLKVRDVMIDYVGERGTSMFAASVFTLSFSGSRNNIVLDKFMTSTKTKIKYFLFFFILTKSEVKINFNTILSTIGRLQTV